MTTIVFTDVAGAPWGVVYATMPPPIDAPPEPRPAAGERFPLPPPRLTDRWRVVLVVDGRGRADLPPGQWEFNERPYQVWRPGQDPGPGGRRRQLVVPRDEGKPVPYTDLEDWPGPEEEAQHNQTGA